MFVIKIAGKIKTALISLFHQSSSYLSCFIPALLELIHLQETECICEIHPGLYCCPDWTLFLCPLITFFLLWNSGFMLFTMFYHENTHPSPRRACCCSTMEARILHGRNLARNRSYFYFVYYKSQNFLVIRVNAISIRKFWDHKK